MKTLNKESAELNLYIMKMNKDEKGLHFKRYNDKYDTTLVISKSEGDSPMIDISGKSYEEIKKHTSRSLIYIIKSGPIHSTATFPDFREATQIIKDTETTIKRHAEHLKNEGDTEELKELRKGIGQHLKKLKNIKQLIQADTEEEESRRFYTLKEEAEEEEENKTIEEIKKTKPGTLYDITQEIERRIEATRYQATAPQILSDIIKETGAHLKHIKI